MVHGSEYGLLGNALYALECKEMPGPLEKFYKSLFGPKLMTVASENKSFAVSSMHLKLRREYKKDSMKVEQNKVGIGL